MIALRLVLAALALGIIAAMIAIAPKPRGCATVGHVGMLGCR